MIAIPRERAGEFIVFAKKSALQVVEHELTNVVREGLILHVDVVVAATVVQDIHLDHIELIRIVWGEILLSLFLVFLRIFPNIFASVKYLRINIVSEITNIAPSLTVL